MTVESYAQAPAYTIAGVGPYPIPHPYLAGTIAAYVLIEDVPTQLDGADFSVDPATAADQGNLLLTDAAATTHAGRTLWIERATPLEQGWMARDDGREAGMEAQLDQDVMGAQEDRAQISAALRARKPMAAFDPQPGRVPLVRQDGDGWENGPTADQVEAAQGYAEAAKASADRIDLGVLDASVQATAGDAQATAADRVQTGLDRIAAEDAASNAAADANAQIAPNVAAAQSAKTDAETARDLADTYAGVVSRATSVGGLTDPATLAEGDKGYISGSGDDAVDGLYEVQSSAWVRVASTGFANATYARRRMVTDVFRRGANKVAERLTQRRSIYDNIIAAARSRLLRSAASADLYCSPAATGANDGTSWADAFTDLDTAFNAMSNGDRLFIDGDFGSTVTVTLASSLEGIEVITDRGAIGYTKFDGRIYAGDVAAGTFADEGGGVFSVALAAEPKAVAFNLTQDETSGTITGVDLTASRKANLISEWSRDPARMAAWYGFLKKAAAATNTPAEGEWSYSGGNLYIFPSGSPTLAEVNSGACWADGASGLKITGAELTGAYIHGDLWTFFTPSPDGNSGYGLELENARFVTVEGHWADLWGYHAAGFAASSKNGNVAIKCTASGAMPADNTSSGALAYVFFTQVGNFYSDGARGHDLFFNAYPLLDQSGAPINTKFSPQIGYHHTGGGYTLTDVQWTYPCQIDHNAELAAKHAVTLTSSPAFVGAGSFSTLGDVNDPTPWETVVRYGKGDGAATFPQPRVDHYDCEIDRSGYGSATDILILLSAAGGQYQFRYNGGVLSAGAADYVFGPASTGDKVALRGVDVSFGTAAIATTLFYSGDLLGEFYLGSSIVRSPGATGTIVEVGTTNWANWPNVITSEGGNIFTSDFDADDRVARAANPAGGIANMAEFIAAIDPTGRDVTEADTL